MTPRVDASVSKGLGCVFFVLAKLLYTMTACIGALCASLGRIASGQGYEGG